MATRVSVVRPVTVSTDPDPATRVSTVHAVTVATGTPDVRVSLVRVVTVSVIEFPPSVHPLLLGE